MRTPDHDDAPVLITAAEPSYQEQFAARKRRYMIMMSLRVPCLILAVLLAHVSWVLALGVLALSIPLPWMAVLIANDRAPRKVEKVNRYHREPTAIEATDHQVIEG